MTDERFVAVEVATELLDDLAEWSGPVQVRIERDRKSTTGWTMTFRRYDPEDGRP